ncbi:flagellin [Ureibacillus chungkukjangi]|uniref:flagellin N-terminal helical domain-containing protein n=1 Tax=Ureibacillus chungkukjangi TaxID=1202712 RepID=UPI002559CC99|nr:flagellin [Ureibacillus chungkukjangi]
MRIQHNISALNTHRNLSFNNSKASQALEKLSSGYEINRAGDDAAGLAISEKMRGQIRGLDMASKNAQDGISLIQTAEGAMNEVHSLLQRGRELAVQAANDTNVEEDRKAIQLEIDAINEEIDRIGSDTEFNTRKILQGMGVAAEGFDRDEFLKKLKEGWLEAAEKAVKEGLPSVFDSSGVQEVKVVFMSDGQGVGYMAKVSGTSNTTNPLTLTIDDSDFSTSSESYQKQTMVHEMVHAAMFNNGTVIKSPGWFAEGIAEFVPGSEDRLNTSIAQFGTNAVVNASMSGGNDLSQAYYASSYAATIYLNSKLEANSSSMAGFIDDLESKSFDQALQDNIGMNRADFEADFKANGAAFLSNLSGVKTSLLNDFESYFAGSEEISTSTNLKFDYTFDQSSSGSLKIHIGGNDDQNMSIDLPYISSGALGVGSVNVLDGGSGIVSIYDRAIDSVSTQRANLGAYQNRLEHTINSLGATSENLQASESRIRETNMASEIMNFTKQNILMQVAQSMLAQANQQQQGVLQLLG